VGGNRERPVAGIVRMVFARSDGGQAAG
jgi:hypothetical protein